jgi:MtN3 and saliva related transmembrane protein
MEKTMVDLYELIGMMGSLILCASTIPQIIKTYQTKRSNDLSILYLTTLLLGMVFMVIFSLHVGDPVFIFGNSLSVISVGILIFFSLRYRR